MKDMREGEMRHVAPGTNPNEHIRTDSQIRLSGKKTFCSKSAVF